MEVAPGVFYGEVTSSDLYSDKWRWLPVFKEEIKFKAKSASDVNE